MDSSAQEPPAEFSLPLYVSAPARPSFWRRLATRRFFFISVIVHLLFGAVASVFVVQTITARKKNNFVGTSPAANASTHAIEHKVQMQKKQQTMSAPAQAKRITTTAINTRVALPVIPAMPSLASQVSPMQMAGMGGAGLGLTMGSGGGSGSGGGGGRGLALFGLRQSSGSALVGTFYDFKQTPDGQPTSMKIAAEGMLSEPERPANQEDMQLVGRFANGGFNEEMFSKYFKGPSPLYTTQIFIPVIPSDLGPNEFNLGDKVKGRRWAVVYRGKVTPPESGTYHFVGVADDYLLVRFRERLVLDGSLFHPSGKKPLREFFTDGLGGAMRNAEGDRIDVNAGDHYDIEILIGEQPGGETCAFLMLEKEGIKYSLDSKGNPILPIFKMAPNHADRTGRGAPVTSEDTSWSVWKAEK